MPPQPSPMGPQLAPAAAQVRGVQAGGPHTLGVPPPPQVSGAVHMPQSSTPPQPSPTGPQLAPASAHVRAVQVGGGGATLSSQTGDVMSKNMNSSASSCGVRLVVTQPLG